MWPSKRSGINLNFSGGGGAGVPEADALVDMFRGGRIFGPVGAGWATGAMWNADNVDPVTGIPNSAGTRTRAFGGDSVWMVPSSEFSGKRVLTWQGNGRFTFASGTWTVDTDLSSDYDEVSNGVYTGTDPYIVVTYTGAGGLISSRFDSHDSLNTGDFVTEAHFYRLEDEARFLAGKVYRTGYLQIYVDLNPGYVRFMNTGAINNSQECRYEHHNKSTQHSWGGFNHLACDTYGEVTGTNQYAIADSAGSPVAMKHGEVVIGRVTNGLVRSGNKTVTAVTKANPGVVTATAHSYNTGDIIVHNVTGMTELNFVPCTITVDDADHYQLGIDTSAFTDFTAGVANQYVTLDRGGLGAYPVTFEDGTTPASHFSNAYIAAGDYKTFSFDKYCVASTLVTGAWIFSNLGATPKTNGLAPEIMAQFIIELNEMQVAQSTAASPLGPTDMYICVPHRGLLSVDPDYDVASHFGIGLVGDILNGANGYQGLATNPSTAARCSLIVEGSNEDWNSGGTAFSQTGFQARLGFLRYGGAASDNNSYSTVRKVVLVNDLKSAFPAHPQLKYVICGQGTWGIAGPNEIRINGSANYDGDAWNIWGGAPMDHFDGFGYASYFFAPAAFDTANLATLAANYAAAATDEAREAECQTYVDGIIGSGTGETISRYRNILLPAYCDEMASHGKIAFQYEAGWDHSVTAGTEEVNAFLVACKKSRAWARAYQYNMRGFISQSGNANVATRAFYPADYVMIEQRWGHCYPHTYLNGVEGAGLDMAWVLTGKNNRGIYSFIGSA